MIEAEIKVDTAAVLYELGRLQATSRKDQAENVKATAKAIIRRVIRITPPFNAGGSAAAKEAGQAAIASDLRKIFMPVGSDFIASFMARHSSGTGAETISPARGKSATVQNKVLSYAEMAAWHMARRSKSTGRVVGSGRAAAKRSRAGLLKSILDAGGLDAGIVDAKDFEKYRKEVQKRVGILDAGWLAGAEAVAAGAPAWVKRHGAGRGAVRANWTGDDIRFTATNLVRFGSNVRDLERRLQWAVNSQASALKRRVEHYLEKRASRVGK